MRGKGPTPHLEPSPEAEEIQRFQPATRVLPETCSFRSPRCTQKWGELDWSFWACLLLLSFVVLDECQPQLAASILCRPSPFGRAAYPEEVGFFRRGL